MAKSNRNNDEAIVPVGQNLPAFLQELDISGDQSLETLQQHRIINRLSIVQSNTPREVKDKFPERSVVIASADVLVAAPGESFDLVPLLFFDEYITWADRKDSESPAIMARSLDPTSEVARKASDFKRMKENYGAKFTMRHTHHLNFVCMLYGSHELRGTPVALSFCKGEFKKGKAFIGALQMRRLGDRPAPIWSGVWNFVTAPRKNDQGEWWGFDFKAATNPWIAQADGEFLRNLSAELLKEYRDRALSVAHNDNEADDAQASSTEY